MQQVEWNIPANVWAGLNTKYDASTKGVMPDEFTADSANYDLSPTGNVVKRNKTSIYNPSSLGSPIKDEYEAVFTSGLRHKLVMANGTLYYTNGDGIFHSVHAGYVAAGNMEFASMNNLVYFGNGIDTPQVYDMGTSYGGVSYTPPTVANAGVTAPSTNLTVGAVTSGGSVPDGAHTYKYTFLYRDTQESNGSAVSGTATAGGGNNTVPLSSIDVGGLGVTARKIYRDNGNGVWLLVGTIANNTATTFSDTAALGTLPIPTDNNAPPLWSLITQFRDRLWVSGVAASQTKLYYSDAGLPDVWPTNNFIQCNPNDQVMAITSFNDKIVVLGKKSFGIILGTTSSDFRYIDISPNIGCTDCRSVQTITIAGVPKLQWLSQFGVYQWDGSNIQLISDKIENLLQFNIQQAQGAFNKNIQDTQADFLAGTQTAGVNLVSDPGDITIRGYMKEGDSSTLTDDPTKTWDSELEWENGTSTINLATADNLDQASNIPNFTPTIAECTLSNLVSSGTSVHTPIASNFTGTNNGPFGTITFGSGYQGIAVPFSVPRGGTVNQVSMYARTNVLCSATMRIYTDGGGQPGSFVGTSSIVGLSNSSLNLATFNVNVAIGTGLYWAVIDTGNQSPGFGITQIRVGNQNARIHTTYTLRISGTSFSEPYTWGTYADYGFMSFTFTQSAVSASGTLATPVYDTKCIGAIQGFTSLPINTVSGTTVTLTQYQSSDPNFLTDVNTVVTTSIFTMGGSISLTNKRYWKATLSVTTTDDRLSSDIFAYSIVFNSPSASSATWISEVIDHTTDIISLDSLTYVGSGGTVTIATSTDNVTYSSFVAVGSAVARRYSKVKLVISSGSVTSVSLNWSITSTFTSSAISTIIIPVQWGAFQTSFDTNGGTLVFQTRSATTEGGLTGASWDSATNGVVIGSPLHLWVQWRVTITAHVSQVPKVHSVVINWLTVNSTGIRVASLFYNQTYFLAAATFNSTTNDIVLYYDRNGRWGQYTNLHINTMGLFYAQAFYGDSLTGDYVRWLDPTITSNQSIELDVRTKAYAAELISDDLTKTLRHAVIEFADTAATISVLYSVDEGTTWLTMNDVVTGLTTYTGGNTGAKIKVRFVPDATSITWGYSIMIRVYNNDQYPVNISGIRAKAYVSTRPVLLRG